MGLFKIIGNFFHPPKPTAPEPDFPLDPDNVLGGSWEVKPGVLSLESDIENREQPLIVPDPVKKAPAKKKAAVKKTPPKR